MSPVVSRQTLPLAVLLACLGTAPAALACPAGEARVCLVSCFCIPGTQEEIAPFYDNLSRMAASGLQAWLESSRRSAAAGQTHGIPPQIRARLEPYYGSRVLDAARYQVGDAAQMSAANSMLQNPDVNAVTLVDIIVFRHAEDALSNVALWAHELKHVEQYQQWGVAEFATRYVRDYTRVEAPAYGIESQVARALRHDLAQLQP